MMILDRYSLQTKAIFVGAIIVAIVGIVLVSNYNNSRSRDVELATNAKLLAGALERYYAMYHSYPEFDKTTVDKVKFITDQGVNENGTEVFYVNKFVWPTDATLAIQNDDYQLDFTVYNSWPAWGVTKSKGGRCRVFKEAAFYCADWQ